jgi:lipoate---protein ligase
MSEDDSDLAWRRLPDKDKPMGRQLAYSEALLAGLAAHPVPALRWYYTSRPALVLGNGQPPAVADLAASQANGVTAYRRTSGGAAVLVDADALSMEVALPAGHPLATFDVVRGYQWMGALWAEALRSLGIAEARAIPTDEVRALDSVPKDDLLRLACYGTLSPWEVVVGRRKVVGLCQVRRRPGALYQVGVNLRWQPQRLTRLLALSPAQQELLAGRLRDVTAGLDELAGRTIDGDEVVAAVETALAARLHVRLTPARWRADERAAAERIEGERFTALA